MNNPEQIPRIPSAESFTQLILETFRLNGRLIAAGDRLTKELGLSSALWQVLGAIDEAKLPPKADLKKTAESKSQPEVEHGATDIHAS